MPDRCQARPERHDPSTIRCAACRLVWEKSEPRVCGKEVALVSFESGLPFQEQDRTTLPLKYL